MPVPQHIAVVKTTTSITIDYAITYVHAHSGASVKTCTRPVFFFPPRFPVSMDSVPQTAIGRPSLGRPINYRIQRPPPDRFWPHLTCSYATQRRRRIYAKRTKSSSHRWRNISLEKMTSGERSYSIRKRCVYNLMSARYVNIISALIHQFNQSVTGGWRYS